MPSSTFPSNVTGVTVQTASTGALSGDGSSGNKLQVNVDGTTIQVNGSNELEAVNGGNPFDQDLNTTDSPTFAGLTIGNHINQPMSAPTNLAGTAGTDGSLAAGAYLVEVSALDLAGNQTTVSNQVSFTIAGPDDGTGSYDATWDAVNGATYLIWVSTDAGSTWKALWSNVNSWTIDDLTDAVSGTPPSTNTAFWVNLPTTVTHDLTFGDLTMQGFQDTATGVGHKTITFQIADGPQPGITDLEAEAGLGELAFKGLVSGVYAPLVQMVAFSHQNMGDMFMGGSFEYVWKSPQGGASQYALWFSSAVNNKPALEFSVDGFVTLNVNDDETGFMVLKTNDPYSNSTPVFGSVRASFISSDGSAGVTVTTCTSFKDGLCVAGT